MNTKKISVLVCESIAPEGLAILKNHPDFYVDVCLDLSKDELRQKIVDYDCLLVRSQTQVDHLVISWGKRLKLIGRAGVGIDNIDIASAKEYNIAVINTPQGNSITTAELAFGLIISLARKIPFAHNHLQQSKWQRSKFNGIELYGKTLGILGLGNVGRQLALRASAFGMKTIAYDPIIDSSLFADVNALYVTLDQLFFEADFLSLHCQLTPDTTRIINEKNIRKMKPEAMLINTARGELIDEQALLSALNNDHISGAALDVFSAEPPIKNPLIAHPKIIATPHIGASTKEAQKRVAMLLAEQSVGFFYGNKNISRVV
jgi:D-3-phosphoglycerate dehydrogenase / 2-oxoglutarate reductase